MASDIAYLARLLGVFQGESVVECMDDHVIITHNGALSRFSLVEGPLGWTVYVAKDGDVTPFCGPMFWRDACRVLVEAACHAMVIAIEDAAADAEEGSMSWGEHSYETNVASALAVDREEDE